VRRIVLCAAVAIIAVPAMAAPRRSAEARKLDALLEADWQWRLEQFPTLATEIGDARYDDRLPDMSPEAIETRKRYHRDRLAKIERIDRSRLSGEDALNYDLFRRDALEEIQADRFPEEYLLLSAREGVHQLLSELAQQIPRYSVKDYENFLARMRAYPAHVDQHIALLRKGLAAGVTPPRIVLEEVPGLIAGHAVADPAQSAIYELAFESLPASIPEPERGRLRGAAVAALRDQVLPSMARFHAFVRDEYVPGARATVGFSALPRGAEWYALRVKRMTTTDLTAEQIHQLGLSEVTRIRAEMEQLKTQIGFQGDLKAFFDELRTDPRHFFITKGSLLVAYRDIAKRVDAELPRLFGRLPRLPYGVVPVPEYSEKAQTTAYYMPGAPEAGRAGLFYANTYDLKVRPRWEMEALTLHEAVPGHHLQISLAQEMEGLPRFRRFGGYTAFVEGWALYAESLGSELGMYQDPYSRFGQLTYEMWRAIRLVVDTGLHAKGWTRDQAIAFFRDNAPKTEHDIRVEVDRYIFSAGQALAYKLGQLKIRELRLEAQAALGERFSVRAFHDQILGAGPLPLALLESRVRAWISGQKRPAG
jgi:uncharacterized protein (DUF885 family)